MLDLFEFRLPTGNGYIYDEFLDEDVEAFEVLFESKGRVKASAGLAARSAEGGGRTIVTTNRELHIPADSPDVPAGAYAVVKRVDPTSDPTLIHARLTIAGPSPGSQTTARRLQVEEVLT